MVKEKTQKTIAKAKKLELDIGNLKIVSKGKPGKCLTGVDFDVFIDGKDFKETPFKNLYGLDIRIRADDIVSVTYYTFPYVSKDRKKD